MKRNTMKRLKKKARGFKRDSGDSVEYRNLALLWSCRILTKTRHYAKTPKSWMDLTNDYLESLGIENRYEEDYSPSELKERSHQLLKRLERKKISEDNALFRNTRLLGESLKLDAKEITILTFLMGARIFDLLEDIIEPFTDVSFSEIIEVISVATNIEKEEVFKRVNANSRLISSGLMQMREVGEYERHLFKVHDQIVKQILNNHESHETLFSYCFSKPSASTLTLDNFGYIKENRDLVIAYLKGVLKHKDKGVNILIYGKPGSGKTELAKLFAEAANASLVEVLTADEEGYSSTYTDRFNSLRLAQSLLQYAGDSIVLFDEAEDVFPIDTLPSFFLPSIVRQKSMGDKGWLNKLLENNQVPTIWIVNQHGQIDPAYKRRFSLSLEMPRPTKKARAEMIASRFEGLNVTRKWVEKIATIRDLMPSDVTNTANVVRRIAPKTRKETQNVAERVIKNNLSVRESSLTMPKTLEKAQQIYSLDYLNTPVDMEMLMKALIKKERGRVMLYGPPGAGKTAFATHLAKRAKRELIIRRASELLDMFVGNTEKSIASMFEEAREKKAFLLLDEADSFFRTRERAFQSWQVTQVNELLVQLENFDGLFICSTNLKDDFDKAAFRRFDFKIRYDYLNQNQKEALLLAYGETIGFIKKDKKSKALSVKHKQMLAELQSLTPGDFATLYRKNEILEAIDCIDDFIEGLKNEIHEKKTREETKPPIGFER